MEQRTHMGTTRITAIGSDQLSYNAARTRNTNTTDNTNTIKPVSDVIRSR